MESQHSSTAQQFQNLNRRLQKLKAANRRLSRMLWIFGLLLTLSIGYYCYAEFQAPLFGSWKALKTQQVEMEKQQSKMRRKLDSLQQANDLLMENSPYYTGVFFEVQIGAFKYFDLTGYNEALTQFRIEQQAELQKFTLGKFREIKQAEAFRKDIERLGIKDAFVVAKIDGKRVSIRQALEEQQTFQM